MEHWIDGILCRLEQGAPAVLAVVVRREGSSPGREGAVLAVSGSDTWGTVGGGPLEAMAAAQAGSMEGQTGVRLQSWDLSGEKAGELGMICGGTADLLYVPLTPEHTAPLKTAARLRTAGRPVSLAFACGGEKTLVRCVGEDLPFTYEQRDGGSLLLLPLLAEGVVRIFGGGHVSLALSKTLTAVEFPYTVYEDRADFVTEERFPDALERICGAYEDWNTRMQTGSADYLVIMTRGHAGDYAVLRQALKTDAAYIGVIGSRKKMALTRQRLLEEGFTQSDLDRIVSPIGLDIGAQTPAEIAVSITAQLIQERSGRR